MTPMELRVGEIVRTKKAHPCGSMDWEITRIGADIGLKCMKCGRRIMVSREDLERKLKQIRPAEPAAILPESILFIPEKGE